MKVFLIPDVRVFDPGQESEVLAWLEKVRVKADGLAASAAEDKVYAGLMGGPAR